MVRVVPEGDSMMQRDVVVVSRFRQLHVHASEEWRTDSPCALHVSPPWRYAHRVSLEPSCFMVSRLARGSTLI